MQLGQGIAITNHEPGSNLRLMRARRILRRSSGKGRLAAGIVALLAAVTATPAAAQGGSILQATDTAVTRQVRSMENIGLAHRLGVYGQRSRQPLPLIAAADILLAHPTRPLAEARANLDTTRAVLPDAARMLASAREYASGNDRLLALLPPLERRARSVDRGGSRGPRQLYAEVQPAASQEHTVEFRGGEPAIVHLSGDGESDLDLFVYDDAGQIVASITGPGDQGVVHWRPERQARFRIEVRNLGRAPNQYWLTTN
jgi:hypothetical protein